MAKILIVDDSGLVRIQVKEMLERHGHEVLEGEDGDAGLKVAEETPDIDIVVADYNMPRKNGLQMLADIRRLPHGKHAHFIVLTTETSPDLKSRGKEIGVLVWIVKPLAEAGFIKTLDKVLTLPRSS